MRVQGGLWAQARGWTKDPEGPSRLASWSPAASHQVKDPGVGRRSKVEHGQAAAPVDAEGRITSRTSTFDSMGWIRLYQQQVLQENTSRKRRPCFTATQVGGLGSGCSLIAAGRGQPGLHGRGSTCKQAPGLAGMQHLPPRLSHIHQQNALIEGVQGPHQALVLLHPHAPGEELWAGFPSLDPSGPQTCPGQPCPSVVRDVRAHVVQLDSSCCCGLSVASSSIPSRKFQP